MDGFHRSGLGSIRNPVDGKRVAAHAVLLLCCALFSRLSAHAAEEWALFVSPEQPWAGGVVRVIVTGEAALKNIEIHLHGPAGEIHQVRTSQGGGPPFWRLAEFKAGGNGNYTLSLLMGRKPIRTQSIVVHSAQDRAAKKQPSRRWGREMEQLYSAWIEALFQRSQEGASWPNLHEITRQADDNFLHNHLGLNEDEVEEKPALIMEPDCADNPFYLRAYFSWKLGLAFGFHETGRGTLNQPPHIGRWFTFIPSAEEPRSVRRMNQFFREIMNTIHSGAARTRLEDESSDYYPLALTRAALRPGAVYADPYGHTFVLVRWVAQQSEKKPGMLLAVDAQPDGTVQIKRFWKGNFLFATEGVIGEPGFKAFRPIGGEHGRPRLLRNREIAGQPGYGGLSLAQKNMRPEIFYDAMERLINPLGLDPESALLDLLKALREQLLVRVESVANGEAYMQAHPGAVIPMPASAAGVFQAGGLWEDYSTPNRDLRLLIAMDALDEFPARVAAAPDHYKISRWKSVDKVKSELERLRGKIAAEWTIVYKKSDGSPQSLTLEEVLKRKAAFEMGYNPNDGIEIRWGAPEKSAEIKSCRRRAPASQVEAMRKLRPWFQKRLHPPT